MLSDEEIEIKIAELPDHIKPAVTDFIDFLLAKYGKKSEANAAVWHFDWEGGLGDLKSRYSAVELQHQATEWR